MSSTWSGFSEEDIRNLKSDGNQSEAKIITEDRKVIKAKRRVQQNNVKSISKNLLLKSTPIVFEVPEEAKLCTKNDEEVENVNKSMTDDVNVINNNEKETGAAMVSSDLKESSLIKNSVTLDVSKIEKRVIDLDEFQARQKLIEEQNRKRKELLAKALADRTKRTEEEARKLKEIQNEFKKLDAMLSNDVSILRHQIEAASLEFMEAQKKYHRIEKEFLEAKLNLHQKLERKEMLTEHLCAIIEKNEERKAEKLSELMNRLEVDANVEESTPDAEKKDEIGDNLIDEVKNRREIKIDLQPNKITDVENENDNNGTNIN